MIYYRELLDGRSDLRISLLIPYRRISIYALARDLSHLAPHYLYVNT